MSKFLLALLLATAPLAAAAERGETLGQSMPEGALTFLETTGLSELIRRVGASEVWQSVMASDDWKEWEKTHVVKEFKKSRRLVEFLLRMDIWEASDKLLGGRLAVATYPAGVGEDPDFAFLIRPSQPSAWLSERIRTAPLIRLGIKRVDRKGYGEAVAAYRTRGFESGATYFAMHPDWIAIASGAEVLQQTVALQRPGGLTFGGALPRVVADEAAFREMTGRMGEKHLARAFLDTGRIEETTGENLGFPGTVRDPVLALFLGGVVELVDSSRFAGFTLDYDDKEIVFRAGIDAQLEDIAEEHQLFFAAGPDVGLTPPPRVPGFIGGFALYRPFGDWYRGKGALIPGMEGFEAKVGDLLLGEGVVGDRVTFVSAQAEDGGIDPAGIRLPGFGFVVDLADPAKADAALGPLFESALVEIDGEREGLAPWEFVAGEHAGEAVSYARRAGDDMTPAAARVGDRWVMASSLSLCRRLIDALAEPPAAGSGGVDLAFDLNFNELSKFFAANEPQYVAEFVRRGRAPAQARADYKNIAKLMAGVSNLSGRSTAGEGLFQFTARGVLK